MVDKRDIAEAMLDLLPHHRTWAHGRLFAGNRRCLLGARLSIGERVELLEDYDVNELDCDPYTQIMARVILDQFPERAGFIRADGTVTAHMVVISFNDDVATRFTDVRMILEKTAAACMNG
jgi:hypothetical protein